MTLNFKGSNTTSLGVEIELQILEPYSLNLFPETEKILEICKKQGLERVKAEVHQSMLEVDSEISLSVKECKEFLTNRLISLNEIIESQGLQLAVTGTHPFQRWGDRLITDDERYHYLHEKFRWLIRRMNVYGMHVHVGVATGELALQLSQAMFQYFPHLIALSANSPFWQGIDTGMQSSRLNILESFPFAGLPPKFTKWQDLEHYYNTLQRVGAINSLKDLYWYIRPNLSYGTIEFRICDAASTLTETMAIVAFIHCIVVWTIQHLDKIPPWTQEHHWLAPENQWIAARDGLEGMIITDYLDGKRKKISESILELIEILSPIAENLNCLEELKFLNQIITYGNGAQRQKKYFLETGSLEQVVALTRQEFISDLYGGLLKRENSENISLKSL